MPNAPGKISQRAVTAHVRRLGAEVHTSAPDGTPLTRDEALAELLWKMALGYEECIRNEDGTLKKVTHPPVAWAMQYIYERKEGKAPLAVAEDEGRIKASDRVRELAVGRLNQLALKHAGVVKGPPKHKPKQEKS